MWHLISLPMVPVRKPSPLHTTREALLGGSTVTYREINLEETVSRGLTVFFALDYHVY
jgi:hypothetical protein